MEKEKKKKGSHKFQKGNPGGPGRPRLTPEQKKVSKLTRAKFNTMVRDFLDKSAKDLNAILKSKDVTVLEKMVLQSMHNAMESGDQQRINWYLEQLFGKLKETKALEISGSLETMQKFDLNNLSKKELYELKKISEKAHGEK